ncbi:hypothetical protein BRC91_12355 [Halobacteriales archaeon QS_4_62_28]|nr:MAG: hypothetical protein BRC91_12355 [Halobacteriales archaeon QS_4_62_28]
MADSSAFETGRGRQLVRDALLIVGSLIFVFPVVWIAWTAFKPAELSYKPGATEFTPTLESFTLVLTESSVPLYFFNTLVIAMATTVISLTVGGLAAYAITRYRSWGRKMYFLFLIPILLPPITLVVSMFFVYNIFGITDSRVTIVLAQMSFAIPFAVWFLTEFFRELPVTLEEAAMVDGDTRIEAILYILVPNVKNGIFAAGVIIFIYSWNNFLFPLLLTGEGSRTLPVELNNFNTFEGLLVAQMSAGILITIIPVLILAFFVQKQLVTGIAVGSGVD